MAGPGVLLSRYDGWSEPGDEVKGRKRVGDQGCRTTTKLPWWAQVGSESDAVTCNRWTHTIPGGRLKMNLVYIRRGGKQTGIVHCGIRLLTSVCLHNFTHVRTWPQ